MGLDAQTVKRLAVAAVSARRRAYAPYSHFLVGAAILTECGQVIEGCNVENASYGLTICAERGAVATAIAAGFRQWQAIAIASQGGVTPCGACRQVLMEFGADLQVLLIDAESGQCQSRCTLADLLPGAFKFQPKQT